MKIWKEEDIADFASQLSGFLEAGIPLLQSLEIMADQMRGKRKERLHRVRSGIEQGYSLKAAFEAGAFPPLFLSLVALAEAHGRLADTLKLVSEWYRRKHAFQQHIKRQLSYPVFIFLLLFTLLSYLIFFLLPRLQRLLLSFRQELPPSAEILFSIALFLQQHLFHLLTALTVLSIAVFSTGWLLHRNNRLIPVLLAFPGLRHSLQLRYTYFFASQLGLLLEAGMGILQALQEIRLHSPYRHLSANIAEIEKEILEGKPLSSIRKPLLAQELYRLASLGEKQGTLGAHLLMCSLMIEQKVNRALQFFIRWIEPIVVLAAGSLIGFVIIAVFLPILQLVQSI